MAESVMEKIIMKCNKCKAEWTLPPGKSVTVCPFCSEATQTPSSDTASGNIIKDLIQQYGESVLLEQRLLSLVADKLQNNDPRMLRRIRLAINEGLPKKLYALKSLSDEQERGLKTNILTTALRDDYGMETEAAYGIVNYFCEALGYKPVTAPQSAVSSKPATSQSGQQPPTPQAKATSSPNGIKITPKIGSIIPFGSYDWRVLDVQNNKALILSDRVVEERAYHSSGDKVTWEACTLRSYLNETFYNTFSASDKARIMETEVITYNNPWYCTMGSSTTNDRIFLLSIEEAIQYFGDSGDLKNRKGWYWENEKDILKDGKGYYINDQYNSARIAVDKTGTASWWWLRSPGRYADEATVVDDGGCLFVDGCIGSAGVRPALCLNL